MLDFPVSYGPVALNSVEMVGDGLRRGTLLEEFDYARNNGVGYTEKRAQDDGLDASDVFMGPRYINLTGVTYGTDPGDLFDRLQDVRTILTPTIAYASDEYHYGYIPLEFSMPTNRTDDFPGGLKPLEFRARPLGQPTFTVRRDAGSDSGGGGWNKGGAVLWRATLECRDPRMYVRPVTIITWTGAVTAAPISNRGDYPAPVDIRIVLATASASTDKVEIDLGQSNMTIALGSVSPAAGYPIGTIFRYSGSLKVLTVQQPGLGEVLAMDLLTFRNNTTHPAVPPGDTTYTIRTTPVGRTFTSGTNFTYSESFA